MANIDRIVADYQAQIRRQAERLGVFLEFLQSRDLVNEFNDWEEAKRGSTQPREPEARS